MSTDKRVLKTKKAITTAFMELTLEKDIRKITVSDIAERAVINRSTFYLHYADAKDVLDDIERDISDTVYECFSKFDTSDIYNSTYNMLLTLTGTLDNNPAFKNFMLFSTSSMAITAHIKRTLAQKALQASAERATKVDGYKMTVAINYMVSGIIDTYIQWADSADDRMNLQDFCRLVSQFTEAVISLIN